jgi:hypothetical protein
MIVTALHDFALLAPVPLEHLQSGLAVAEKEGFVAFGTRKWSLLRDLEVRQRGHDDLVTARVAVLIYQSVNEDAPAQQSHVVSWFGWYAGSEETSTGAHSGKMKYRPPTTAASPTDNVGHWAAFWHVRALRKLPPAKRISIGKIGRIAGGLRKDAAPHGPELVALPELLRYEA